MEVAPAPWTLKGRGYAFLLSFAPFSTTPVPLPEGAYHPFEKGTTADLSARYHGGVGIVMLVRYEGSPVGPYDELLLIPGQFSKPGFSGKDGEKLETTYSVTRIYVSNEASVLNGRRNWGIPKHLAKFTFSSYDPSSPNSTYTISVTHPAPNSTPFFRATLSPSVIPSFPISTKWINGTAGKWLGIPKGELMQPMLPDKGILTSGGNREERENLSRDLEEMGEKLDNLVSSPELFYVSPEATGTARLYYLTPLSSEESSTDNRNIATTNNAGEQQIVDKSFQNFGDGTSFPKLTTRLGGMGTRMEFEMEFPVPLAN